MAYFVYLLRCSDGTLYTGMTTDLHRRYAEHRSRGPKCAGYTRSHPVVRMEAAFQAEDRSQAARLEAAIKKLSRAEKEQLLRDPSGRGLVSVSVVTD